MELMELSDDIIEQIKDFNVRELTEEQNLLIDKLILNEELKERYERHGLCMKCKQVNTDYRYCWSCQSKYLQQNFKNWTSGNHDIDEFIQDVQLNAKKGKEVIEWIEYNRFDNVEFLAEGGFGTTYKAIWKDGRISHWDSDNNQWIRHSGNDNIKVALKCLHNSQDITSEFLREIKSHVLTSYSAFVIDFYGITKDLNTNNFMMVMRYAKNGSLRHVLNNDFSSMNWNDKTRILRDIAFGLVIVHSNGLIHRDFHCGNILRDGMITSITDLGLCKPADEPSQNSDKKIYGVLPYVAPEVLKGKEYTQESDIYGFGIVAYEVCTGLPPYHDINHDEFLVIRICQGLRPTSNYKIPQMILDVINQCWDADPSKRPKAEELKDLFMDTICGKIRRGDKQVEEADLINKNLSSLSYKITNSQTVYTSKLLDFKNLPEPKNAEYSETVKMDFTKLNINDSKDENN